MRITFRLFALFALFALGACGSPTPASPDTGTSPTDAGHDAAPPMDDAGPVADAGSDAAPITDAGASVDAATVTDASSTDDAAVTCTPSGHTFMVHVDPVGGLSAYTIDGTMGNPALQLCAGASYMFDLTTVSTSHPMQITGGATTALFLGGVTTSYTAPTAAPFPTAYSCEIHGFGGSVVVH
jgi:hypothetical protein